MTLRSIVNAEHVPASVSARNWWQIVLMVAWDTGEPVASITAGPWKLEGDYLRLGDRLWKLQPDTLSAVRQIGGAA